MESEKKIYIVYSLVDPFDLKIKYVGINKTDKPKSKNYFDFKNFIWLKHNEPLKQWMHDLNDKDCKPKMTVLKRFYTREDAVSMQKTLIKKLGNDLLNIYNN